MSSVSLQCGYYGCLPLGWCWFQRKIKLTSIYYNFPEYFWSKDPLQWSYKTLLHIAKVPNLCFHDPKCGFDFFLQAAGVTYFDRKRITQNFISEKKLCDFDCLPVYAGGLYIDNFQLIAEDNIL